MVQLTHTNPPENLLQMKQYKQNLINLSPKRGWDIKIKPKKKPESSKHSKKVSRRSKSSQPKNRKKFKISSRKNAQSRSRNQSSAPSKTHGGDVHSRFGNILGVGEGKTQSNQISSKNSKVKLKNKSDFKIRAVSPNPRAPKHNSKSKPLSQQEIYNQNQKNTRVVAQNPVVRQKRTGSSRRNSRLNV